MTREIDAQRTGGAAAFRMRVIRHGGAALVLAAALLAVGTSTASAADESDPQDAAPFGSMVIAVVVPDHDLPASPSPSPSTTQGPTAGGGSLPRTGVDLGELLPLAAVGLAAAGLGTALVVRRRSRRRASSPPTPNAPGKSRGRSA